MLSKSYGSIHFLLDCQNGFIAGEEIDDVSSVASSNVQNYVHTCMHDCTLIRSCMHVYTVHNFVVIIICLCF